MKSLTQIYKKIIFLLAILILTPLLVFILKIPTTIYLKIFLIFLFLSLLISFLTILEITNSLSENLILWLIVSLFLSYFYLYAGLILFVLALTKIFSQNHLLKNSLKIPFASLVGKNYNFLLLALFLINALYFYQFFINQKNFPLSFSDFQKFTTATENFLYFFKINLSFKEKVKVLGEKFLERYNLPKPIINLFTKALPEETLEKTMYASLENGWQNYKLRKIYFLSFLTTIFLIFYPFLRIFSFLIGYFSLLFYYLFLKINLVKINLQSLNKEVLEL